MFASIVQQPVIKMKNELHQEIQCSKQVQNDIDCAWLIIVKAYQLGYSVSSGF